MKKTLGKPENWQDFESLCKKLWGEIFSIPNKIKKNGRLGQEQAGVDVYGILCVKRNYSISYFFCYFPKYYCFVWGIPAST